MAYRRNQVIEAIAVALASDGPSSSQIPMRLKRLLQADRLLKRNPRSRSAEQSTYAFFSGELSGTGSEYFYSPFEAFALLLGIRLLENGFPQRTAVRILRSLRSKLEDSLRSEWAEPRWRSTNRWYLARLSLSGQDSSTHPGVIDLCRGESAVANFLKTASDGQIMTVIELTRPMLRFKAAIEATVPARRGRR